jgi:hypothetical protein
MRIYYLAQIAPYSARPPNKEWFSSQYADTVLAIDY